MKTILISFLLIFSHMAFSNSPAATTNALLQTNNDLLKNNNTLLREETCLLRYQIKLQEYNACLNKCIFNATALTSRLCRNCTHPGNLYCN